MRTSAKAYRIDVTKADIKVSFDSPSTYDDPVAVAMRRVLKNPGIRTTLNVVQFGTGGPCVDLPKKARDCIRFRVLGWWDKIKPFNFKIVA